MRDKKGKQLAPSPFWAQAALSLNRTNVLLVGVNMLILLSLAQLYVRAASCTAVDRDFHSSISGLSTISI